jgi:hypothetical protein
MSKINPVEFLIVLAEGRSVLEVFRR